MKNHPQPSPAPAFAASRRTLLALFSGAALWSLSRRLGAIAATTEGAHLSAADFLRLSQALTGHRDLSPITASRIERALAQNDASFEAQAYALGQRLRVGMDASALLAEASQAGLRAPALAIVAAWYTGTVGQGATAKVLSYYEALMYRSTQDVFEVPSYCRLGAQAWLRAPPAVGVSAPV